MPIIGSIGGGSAGGYGQRKGGFGPYFIQYLVIAGGGAGGGSAGGGGAGGYRTVASKTMEVDFGSSYPISIGSGGTAPVSEGIGNGSSFNSINTTGGGASRTDFASGRNGGSGGGGNRHIDADGQPMAPGGSGNAGSYSPPEGNPGGTGTPSLGGGGGGAGSPGNPAPSNGNGGSGAPNTISGSDVTYAGGGGGGAIPGQELLEQAALVEAALVVQAQALELLEQMVLAQAAAEAVNLVLVEMVEMELLLSEDYRLLLRLHQEQ
jgi:hypothetical protein